MTRASLPAIAADVLAVAVLVACLSLFAVVALAAGYWADRRRTDRRRTDRRRTDRRRTGRRRTGRHQHWHRPRVLVLVGLYRCGLPGCYHATRSGAVFHREMEAAAEHDTTRWN